MVTFQRTWRVSVLVFAAVLGMAGSAPGRAGLGVHTATLAGMRDRVRPLLIFAPAANDPRLLEQVRIIDEHGKEAADRQLVAVAVTENEVPAAGWQLAEADAVEARRRFHVAAGEFAVVLVGKDGGEKLRATKPFSFEKLREVIDAMPMRREEMKGQGHP